MVKVVGIKFKNGGKLYYFSPKQGEKYARNMPVIVETARGTEFAWVAYPEKRVPDDEIVLPLKPIIRIATEEDTNTYESNLKKKQPAMQLCKERIAKHELDMKLIDCEYAFDGSKITTGIKDVEVENDVKVIYDLTGRKIETITKAGIYIVNGKKVLVK